MTPTIGLLASLQAVEAFGPVPVVDLDELADDALVMPCGGIGAPLIWIEKIGAGDEMSRVIPVVERLLRGEPVAALMSAEIGGSNGMSPVDVGGAGAGCQSSTPTAWDARSPRCRR